MFVVFVLCAPNSLWALYLKMDLLFENGLVSTFTWHCDCEAFFQRISRNGRWVHNAYVHAYTRSIFKLYENHPRKLNVEIYTSASISIHVSHFDVTFLCAPVRHHFFAVTVVRQKFDPLLPIKWAYFVVVAHFVSRHFLALNAKFGYRALFE